MLNNIKKYLLYALAGILLLLGAFAGGRYSTPTKVVTQTQIQYQDKIVYQDRIVDHTVTVEKKVYIHDSHIHKHTSTTTTDTINKDGSETKVTVRNTDVDNQSTTKTNTNNVTENTHTDEKKVTEDKKLDETQKTTTTYANNNWRIAAVAGFDVTKLSLSKTLGQQLVFGGEVDRKIVGPLYAGAVGLSNGTVGLTLSLGF